jgi:hypothetical protein
MSGAVFNTITGADWVCSLRASRARRTRHAIEIADIRRRASEARASYQLPVVINGTDAQRDNVRATAETPTTRGESL